MGLGGLNCCSCNNLKKTVYLDIDEEQQKEKSTPKIEDNINSNESTSRDFNKKGSYITNAFQFKQSELKMEYQPEKDDEFDNMFNMLQSNSYNKKYENN